jgi:hypothetical protein
MDVRWTVAAAALALAACSTTQGTGRDQTARAEPTEDERGTPDAAAEAEADEQAISTRPTEGAGGQNPHPDPAGADRLEGRVAGVITDGDARELVIDAGDATTQVRLADDARITVEGKESSFSDLRPGANVRVSLDRSGDVPEATEIEVLGSR